MSGLLFNTSLEVESEAWYCEVLLPLPLEQAFNYKVPKHLKESLVIGGRVVVQFGKRKIYSGIVIKINQEAPSDYIPKIVIDILDVTPIVDQVQLKFWTWIAGYYCCTIGEVMAAALPASLRLQSETRILLDPNSQLDYATLSEGEYNITELLELHKSLTISQISEYLGQKSVLPLVTSLYERRVILIEELLQSGYKPKKEVHVKAIFDITDQDALSEALASLKRAPKQADLLMGLVKLYQEGDTWPSRSALIKAGYGTSASLSGLIEKGLITLDSVNLSRLPIFKEKGAQNHLTAEQSEAYRQINDIYIKKDVVLLHGVTGSGKTHIYMDMIQDCLSRGEQALYLVPEISLTTQLVAKLRDRFGDKIGIYHSKFNADERIEVWQEVALGRYQVVMGVRSALFLPFKKLGLLVIDEEHEHTYKAQDPAPRFHARDAGIYLMTLHGGKCLLGTATPGFETYYNATRGKYGLVTLGGRYSSIKLPDTLLVDVSLEKRQKTMHGHLTSVLFDGITNTLAQGGQVILFQNRRGFSPMLECLVCGWVPTCINCDISLTYHQYERQVQCHYCGYHEPVPRNCKSCSTPGLKQVGFGTEKIQEELEILFPNHKTLRMDQDTTKRKDSYARIIESLESGEAHILVGTQMVTKGLDFDNVRLVGILNADQMLRYPDFRAVERSYQLMEQVSGRAGRRDKRGTVIIQATDARHPMFHYLLEHDYQGFFDRELSERVEYKYPPFYKLIRVTLKHEQKEVLQKEAEALAFSLREKFGDRVLGPEPPPIGRLRNRYILSTLLKFERSNYSMEKAKITLLQVVKEFKLRSKNSKLRLTIDVDPY